MFLHNWWPVNERVLAMIEKASCRQESWHKVFSDDCRKHPTVIQLVQLFLLEHNLVEILLTQIDLAGDTYTLKKTQVNQPIPRSNCPESAYKKELTIFV